MKNFKLFMKAVDEEISEEACVIIFWSIIVLILYICAISQIALAILSISCIGYILFEGIICFSKWSKKVMKKYKQLKGEK